MLNVNVPIKTLSRFQYVSTLIYAQLQASLGARATTQDEDVDLAVLAMQKARTLLLIFDGHEESERFTTMPS